MKCDVIIPTYQSANVLPYALQALAQQEFPPEWQGRLIISDDGSTDATLAVAEELFLPSPWEKIVLSASHTGSAGARNRGLKHAKGDVILLLGADIILRPRALMQHCLFHKSHPDPADVALGMVRWDPRLFPSPLMEWMEHGGQQNNFDALLGKFQADPRSYWYCSHLSLKQELAQTLRFSERLTSYGWEDLSMGHEAAARGVTLYVLHNAIGHHHHWYSINAIAARQKSIGVNISRFQAEHPAVQLTPRRSLANHLRRGIFIACRGQLVLRWCMVFLGDSFSLPRAFLLFTANEFWKGVWRSQGGFFAYLREYNRFFPKKR